MGTQRVHLIRHGETQWSLTGQHTGRTDIALTENGHKVAAMWKPILSEERFALVLTSPLKRARVDRVISRIRAAEGHAVLFSHGHLLRAFAARWIGLRASDGARFLLDTATLCVMGCYRDIPAIKRWNVPLVRRMDRNGPRRYV